LTISPRIEYTKGMPAEDKINLLIKTDFSDSPLGKFIHWAVSVGRWIVVFAELIVICAFLSRFYSDTELANLFDRIRQNKAIVRSALTFEDNFRRTQNKIKAIKEILAYENKPSAIVSQVSKLLPTGVSLSEISVNEETLKFSGYCLGEKELNTFVLGLKTHPQFEQVALTQLDQKSEDLSIFFTISAKIKSVANEPTRK